MTRTCITCGEGDRSRFYEHTVSYCKKCVIKRTGDYRKRNLEWARQYGRDHYSANAEAYRAKTKAWVAANPDKAAEIQLKYRSKNREQINKRARQFKRNNPQKLFAQLLRKYGLEPEDWARMFNDQDGRCAICSDKFNDKLNPACVDHCHRSGRVRALLCDDCNVGLGKFKDSPKLFLIAAGFLSTHSQE